MSKQKALYGIGGLLISVGLIFVIWMAMTMFEFQDDLKAELQQQEPTNWEGTWNSPEVRETIREGYMEIFVDKAIFFIPLLIGGFICVGFGKKSGDVISTEEVNSNPMPFP